MSPPEQQPEGRTPTSSGPHLIYTYEDWQILEDASSLITYYVKRQPAIQKEDKDTIRQVLNQFIPELFFSSSSSSSSCQSLFSSTTDDTPAETTVVEPSVAELPERRRKAANPEVTPEPTTPTRSPPEPPPKMTEEMYSLFFANNNWYFFYRLHHTLCSRLLRIYRQAQLQLLEYRTEKEREKLLCDGRKEKSNGPAMELRLKQPSEVELEEYYPAFLDMVRNLLVGNLDPTHYEDTLREMFTIHAYIGFTMDKLIQNITRQLHHLVSDEICLKVVELYLSEKKRGAAGGSLITQCVRASKETSYQWKAEHCMADENCFKTPERMMTGDNSAPELILHEGGVTSVSQVTNTKQEK
ncbi:unnamed protein product [Ranitomeya imitator]|uniref:Sin3 C-terminal domain-containing protein n=1 Tax=Ranitomeya imitator TaxID=111125 RepID=A0ABN9LR96_9NEOB|nr:unnamed protein product [Ranitomeya imitator]